MPLSIINMTISHTIPYNKSDNFSLHPYIKHKNFHVACYNKCGHFYLWVIHLMVLAEIKILKGDPTQVISIYGLAWISLWGWITWGVIMPWRGSEAIESHGGNLLQMFVWIIQQSSCNNPAHKTSYRTNPRDRQTDRQTDKQTTAEYVTCKANIVWGLIRRNFKECPQERESCLHTFIWWGQYLNICKCNMGPRKGHTKNWSHTRAGRFVKNDFIIYIKEGHEEQQHNSFTKW